MRIHTNDLGIMRDEIFQRLCWAESRLCRFVIDKEGDLHFSKYDEYGTRHDYVIALYMEG